MTNMYPPSGVGRSIDIMVQSYDAGSLPFIGDIQKFLTGSRYSNSTARDYFEEKVVEAFLDKIEAGIDIPNYPQFRDMNEMFLQLIVGIERTGDGYVTTGKISIQTKKAEIPEVNALRIRSREIYERISEPFKMRICVTGPYTLSSFFPTKQLEILDQLGDVVSRIVDANIFSDRYGSVELVAIDEPVFGLLNDPRLDHGSPGRQVLSKAWERIFHKAKSRNTRTCLHLHSTANLMFWEVTSLDVVESHVDDSLYQLKTTKRLLEEKDKFLKASIGITDFDILIRNNIILGSKEMSDATVNRKLGDVWKDIYRGKRNPASFLETVDKMTERLINIIDRFGKQRVPYAGLECALKGFPTYESAIEYLRRSSQSVRLSIDPEH